MDSKKLLIDFSPNIRNKGKDNETNKKVEMEKERKKRVVTTKNQWIKNELTPQQELELLQQIKNEEFLEKVNSINEKTYIQMKPYIDANYEKAKEYGRDLFQRIKEQIIKYRDEKLFNTNILWTIGILTVPQRKDKLSRLIAKLNDQLLISISHRIEILILDDDGTRTVGDKRNEVLDRANGKYISFIDDDDLISENYILKIFNKLNKEIYDGIGFWGLYYISENPIMLFNHANINNGHFKKDGKQYRPLNHLNPVRTKIAKSIRFPNKNYAEDSDYCDRLLESGLIKSEYNFDEVMYHYLWSPSETLTQK